MLKAISIILVAFMASGCATDVYEGEVQTFSTNVGSTKSAFDSLVKTENDAYFEREVHDLTMKKAVLRIGAPRGECEQIDALLTGTKEDYERAKKTIQNCGLYYQYSVHGTMKAAPVGERAKVDQGERLLNVLNDYATNLAEVSAAKDVEALNASAAKLRASVGNLITTVNKQSAALSVTGLGAITEGVDAISKIGLWVFQKYQQHLRFTAFKAAVEKADPAIQKAAKPLGEEIDELNVQLIINQMGVINTKLLAQPRTRADVEAVQSSYDALRALATTRGSALAKSMAEAHGQLRKAVEDPSTQKEALFNALGEFATLVDQMRSAASKLAKGG